MKGFFHRAPVCLLLLGLVISSINIPANAEDAKFKQLQLPLIFEQNQGQISNQYLYRAQRDGIETRYLNKGVDLFVPQGPTVDRLQLRWVDANAKLSLSGEEKLPGYSNYLRGNDPTKWLQNIPQFSNLTYKDIYSGIDLVFHGNGKYIEHDFIVRTGSEPSEIELQLDKPAHLDSNGDLEIELGKNAIQFRKPIAYQEEGSTRREIEADFVLSGHRSIKFRVGAYDHTRTLVIDPVFVFSTYLAGTGSDQITGVTADAAGNVYATGSTTSMDFPVKNAEQSTCSSCGDFDVFVSKFDPTGHTLLYSSYLGGSNSDFGGAIKVDNNGNIVVVGLSLSSDFPHAGSVPALTCQINDQCYFISSLKSDGSALNYSGLVGGRAGFGTNGNDGQLAVDSAGNAYLAGTTNDQNFQFTPGTMGHGFSGYPSDGMFVQKIGPTGALLYSTVIVGSLPFDPANSYNNLFMPNAILVDSNGQATIAGFAGTGLPTTPGVVQDAFPNSTNTQGPQAGFVLQLNAAATAINFATYIPGTDIVTGMARDVSGNYYLGGATGENNLPVSSNAYQKTLITGQICGCFNGFVLKLDNLGKNVLGATYISSNPNDNGTTLLGLVLDSHSNIFVSGFTATQNFPMKNPFLSVLQSSSTGGGAILAEFDSGLSTLQFGSYLSSTSVGGGSRLSALAMDSQDHPIVAGITWATDFPTTPSSFQPVLPPPLNPLSIPYHSFISELDMATPAPSACYNTINFGDVPVQTTTTQTLNLTNCGNKALHLSSIVSSSSQLTATQACGVIAPGSVCPISLKYSPTVDDFLNGTVSITDDAVISPQIITVAGQGIGSSLNVTPTSVSFGDQNVGQTSAATTVTLNNSSTQVLSIGSITTVGDFSQTNDCGTSLAAGVSCHVLVAFTPTASGSRAGTLTINDTASGSPHNVTLSGNGIASTLTIGPAEGGMSTTVHAGQAATYSLSVAGTTGLSGTISFACTGAPLHATCTVSPTTATLTSGSATNFTVTVSTSTTTASLRQSRINYSTLWLIAAFVPLLVFARQRPRKSIVSLAIVVLGTSMLFGGLTGCGGGSGGNTTPPPPTSTTVAPGTYTLTITATVGSVTSSQHLTLVVHQ